MAVTQGASRGREVLFLLGVAGSGKTQRCIESLRKHEAEGEAALYLVPEQSTYIADRQILEPPGPAAVRHVRVVSFRRLGYLLEEPGASARGQTLDRSGRRILLRALFGRLDPVLQRPFATVADRPGFLESLVGVFREIRDQAGVEGPALVETLAGRSDLPGDLRAKLATVAALRKAYSETLRERGMRDPDLFLADAPGLILAHGSRFHGRPVLVDGFLSFTKLETEILAALAQTGARLTIALCLDPSLASLATEIAPPPPQCRITEWPKGFAARAGRPIFLAPLRSLAELLSRFHSGGFPTRVEALGAPAPRYRSGAIARMASGILSRDGKRSGSNSVGAGAADGDVGPGAGAPAEVEILAARDPSHEVELWARRVDQWTRLDRAAIRPGEVAIIVRDLETYRPLVEETFAQYRVPVFVDRHWDLSSRPLVRTILDALEVLRTGWQRDAVIAFLRSPCLGIRGGEIDLVENLSLEAGYDYGQWKGPAWEPLRHPPRTRYVRGDREERPQAGNDEEDEAAGGTDAVEDSEAFVPRDASADHAEDTVERARTTVANRIRELHLRPLELLEAGIGDGAGGEEFVAALRGWMEGAGLARCATGPDGEREIEAIESVCESVAKESSAEKLSIDGFTRLLGAGLQSLKIGRTPTRPDAVVLAEIQRSRLGEVRRAIVGGLSARDFPRAVAPERFFTEGERALLARLGLDLGTPDPLRQEEEAYFLYIALTRASEALVLTRPTTDVEGSSLDPSPFLEEVRAALPGLKEIAPEVEENPADLSGTQTIEELAAHVGAYIASRLDRRLAGRGAEPDDERAAPEDRRILTVYNRLAVPPVDWTIDASSILAECGRSWGYCNRASLPEAVARLAVGDRSHAASVGRLESFARCPYQHFARHMLRLTRRAEAKVTPLENGLLTHKALEVLLKQGVPQPERAAIEKRLSAVFEQIKNEPDLKAFTTASGGPFRWQSTRGRLRRFLEIETLRLADSDFHPAAFELEFGTEATPALRIPLPDGRTLLVRGRIDRLDLAETEGKREALVIDYKSGAISGRGRPVDLLRGTDLQLAVYLLVASEVLGFEPFGALYAPVLPKPRPDLAKSPENPLDIRLIGLLPQDDWDRVARGHPVLKGSKPPLKTSEELRELLRGARETLALYAGALMRGRIDVAPAKILSKSPCEACELKSLCRVDEAYNPFRASPKEGLAEEDPS